MIGHDIHWYSQQHAQNGLAPLLLMSSGRAPACTCPVTPPSTWVWSYEMIFSSNEASWSWFVWIWGAFVEPQYLKKTLRWGIVRCGVEDYQSCPTASICKLEVKAKTFYNTCSIFWASWWSSSKLNWRGKKPAKHQLYRMQGHKLATSPAWRFWHHEISGNPKFLEPRLRIALHRSQNSRLSWSQQFWASNEFEHFD